MRCGRQTAERGQVTERDESGETLAEVLSTIVIIGLAIAALLAGLSTTILSTSRHRDLATADTLIRGYAEALKQASHAGYINSASTYNITSTAYTLPSGWAAPANQVLYPDPNPCPGTDPGTQQVRVTVTTPRNVTQSLDIWVRRAT